MQKAQAADTAVAIACAAAHGSSELHPGGQVTHPHDDGASPRSVWLAQRERSDRSVGCSERPSPVGVAEAALAIVHALERLHAARVLHLDLTLENVLLDRAALRRGDFARAATIVDFGAAELEDDPEPDRDYAQSVTVDVLPPELVDGAKPPSRAADIWALGVCVYRMLTGRPSPFRSPGRHGGDYAVLQRIAEHSESAALPCAREGSCAGEDAPGLETVAYQHATDFVRRCLHPDPASRLGVVSVADARRSPSCAAAALTVDYDEVRKHPFFAHVAGPAEKAPAVGNARIPAVTSAVKS
jgi:serine/threonine protein kinase